MDSKSVKMNSLNIKATNNTPEVTYEEEGKLIIKGCSIPEDVIKFYQPLIAWAGMLEADTLTVDIQLKFINSSSSKKLLYFLKVLDANNRIRELGVIWHYNRDDEEALEQGQIYEELLLRTTFRYVEDN